jgi:hypothetical protein
MGEVWWMNNKNKKGDFKGRRRLSHNYAMCVKDASSISRPRLNFAASKQDENPENISCLSEIIALAAKVQSVWRPGWYGRLQ